MPLILREALLRPALVANESNVVLLQTSHASIGEMLVQPDFRELQRVGVTRRAPAIWQNGGNCSLPLLAGNVGKSAQDFSRGTKRSGRRPRPVRRLPRRTPTQGATVTARTAEAELLGVWIVVADFGPELEIVVKERLLAFVA